ncbi:MAG: PqqD family peptide modification chaperone [Prevotella sp.]|nr:PqqD family peptide modification chaperone [Prevotella sp.]
MRRTCILCLACVLVSCFCACRGTSATKQIPSEDSTDVARVDNPRFFEVMKPYLSEGYTVKMVPSGISMLPVIHDREDVVLLKETKEVVPGDIVLAEIEKDHYIMHRVVSKEGAGVTLKGDNNPGTEHAMQADVLAKVVGINKGGAKVRGIDTSGQLEATDTYCKNSSLRLDTKGAAIIKVDTVGHMVDMHRIVTFNETAKTIWDEIEKLEDFTLQKMVEIVTAEYDIDMQTAYDDCSSLLQEWVASGLVEKKVIRP